MDRVEVVDILDEGRDIDSRDGREGRSSMLKDGSRVGVGAWTLTWWISEPMGFWWVSVEAVVKMVLRETT